MIVNCFEISILLKVFKIRYKIYKILIGLSCFMYGSLCFKFWVELFWSGVFGMNVCEIGCLIFIYIIYVYVYNGVKINN